MSAAPSVFLPSKSEAKALETKRYVERKKSLIVLMTQHLYRQGYYETAEKLQFESGVPGSKYIAADNVDLLLILQEFEDYYHMKYNRKPKLFRKRRSNEIETSAGNPNNRNRRGHTYETSLTSISGANRSQNHENSPSNTTSSSSSTAAAAASTTTTSSTVKKSKPPTPTLFDQNQNQIQKSERRQDLGIGSDGSDCNSMSFGGLGLVGKAALPPIPPKNAYRPQAPSKTKINPRDALRQEQQLVKQQEKPNVSDEKDDDSDSDSDEGMPKQPMPIPDIFPTVEYRDLAAIINREIFLEKSSVSFGDIAGLETAKRLVKEAAVMPMKFPELFTGLLAPWKGILLFGPPGTGKTMLAKGIAREVKTTFFNISASSIVSKWRGDSEKLVRVLFDLARYHAPSTIFLDEIDSIVSQREDGGGEHEASRRMKTELLVQMDGLSQSSDQVFLLAASNLPWCLDTALLRRLEKRIFVPLPDSPARKYMFERNLPPDIAPNIPYNDYAKKTEGYSGSDIRIVCKESAMFPLRRALKEIDEVSSSGEKVDKDMISLGPVLPSDVEAALSVTKSSAHANSEKYVKWQKEFGSS